MRAVVCLAALAAGPALAADWPQFLGPHRDGTTSEVVKPWTAPPKVLWRQPVGPGHSSPVVDGGRVYLHFLTATPNKQSTELQVYDAATGANIVGHTMERRELFHSPFGDGPRSTPASTGGLLYTLDVTGDLNCYDIGGGLRLKWGRDLLKNFAAPQLKFGVSTSPLCTGGLVIVQVGGKGASVVALDPTPPPPHQDQPGLVRWRRLDDPASYASPIVTEHAGRRQVVALTGEAVVSLDPKTGELFWRHPFRDAINESSTTPLRVGDLIVASSVTLGSVGLKLTTKDGKPAVEVAWKNPALCCYFSTPVAVGDKYVYMVTGSLVAAMTNKPESALNCVEAATGKVLWTKPRVAKFHAALIRTGDGKLLMLADTGDLTLLDPDPKEYRELARAKVCGETWAHPALADGRLYVRDEKELICLQLP
jgi:outer membrane protein assembly factor BamB